MPFIDSGEGRLGCSTLYECRRHWVLSLPWRIRSARSIDVIYTANNAEQGHLQRTKLQSFEELTAIRLAECSAGRRITTPLKARLKLRHT